MWKWLINDEKWIINLMAINTNWRTNLMIVPYFIEFFFFSYTHFYIDTFLIKVILGSQPNTLTMLGWCSFSWPDTLVALGLLFGPWLVFIVPPFVSFVNFHVFSSSRQMIRKHVFFSIKLFLILWLFKFFSWTQLLQ